MDRFITLLLALAVSTFSFAQSAGFGESLTTITLVDPAGASIPFANLYAPSLNTGTVSNFAGELELSPRLLNAAAENEVSISCIGFATKVLTLGALRQHIGSTLRLAPTAYQLPQATVRGRSLTYSSTSRLGFRKVEDNFRASINQDSSDTRGVEIGNIMRVKNSWRLERVGTNLQVLDTTALFEVNIYTSEKGEPGELLNQERLFLKVPANQEGTDLTLDLPTPIYGTGDFIVVLEALQNYEGHEVYFNSKLALGKRKKITRYRTNDGRWQKTPLGIVVAIWCDVALAD